ncbi:gustatory receptor for sugar taste 43a-like [Thrips palmi]|uniref:Gustatory receptor n=1 Tax=Thrips palmi TaxID=161013 RepID=A0A6P8YEK6_THRPL|nr:gustatory receptor for sugar taste 43a-like [Thrips palmi]
MDFVQVKRDWLWTLGRIMGQIPMTFGTCRCNVKYKELNKSFPVEGIHVVSTETVFGGREQQAPPERRCRCTVQDALQPSRTWAAYSAILVLVLVPCSMVSLYEDIQRSLRNTSPHMATKTDRVVTTCDLVLITLCGNMAVIQAWLAREHIATFVEQISSVDDLLRSRAPRVPVLLLAFLMALLGVGVMDVACAMEDGGPGYASLFLTGQANYYLTYTMEAMFADSAHSIFERFRTLNSRLEAACLAARRRPAWTPVRVPPDLEVPLPSGQWKPGLVAGKVAWMQRAPSRENKDGDKKHQSSMPLPLWHLEQAHVLLCESSANVSQRYGPVLLLDMLNLMLHTVISAYFFSSVLMLSPRQLSNSEPYVVLQFFWLLAHVSRMLLLVTYCSKAKDEAKRTGALVGKFLNNVRLDSPLHRELQAFSMQLMHHNVSFTACGMFELGLPLTVSVMGAVATYLVVLLQIKGSSESCSSPDKRSTNAT